MKALFAKVTAVAVLALVADQATKVLARGTFELCTLHGALGCDRVQIGPVQLIRVSNAGSAFGFSQGLWIWVMIALFGLILVLVYARAGSAGPLIGLAAGLQLGGAAGNVLDRVLVGGATDFIHLGGGLVFNVADIALAVGTVLATRALWRAFDPDPIAPGGISTPAGDPLR